MMVDEFIMNKPCTKEKVGPIDKMSNIVLTNYESYTRINLSTLSGAADKEQESELEIPVH